MRAELKRIVDVACEKSPYYRKKLEGIDCDRDSFLDIPLLLKRDMQQSGESLLSEEYSGLKKKELRVERTSGSTGKFTTVYWKKEDYNRSNMNLWRLRNRWYGIFPDSKLVTFNSLLFAGTRLLKPKKITYLDNKRSLLLSKFNMLDSDMMEYFNEINSYEPEWMMVQNSVLARIVDFLQRKKLQLPKSIKYIELNGEATSVETKTYYRDYLRIPIADMYGATEVNGISYECPCGRAHVLEKNVYLETIESEGGYSAVVTSLCNTAMPIIRYELGDLIEIGESEKCDCGLTSSYVKQIRGRISDVIDTSDGRYISPYIFLFCVEKTNELLFHPITEYKLIQRQLDSITILVRIKEKQKNWTETVIEELVRMVEEQKTGINVKVEMIDNSLEVNSEKFKFFERIYDTQ